MTTPHHTHALYRFHGTTHTLSPVYLSFSLPPSLFLLRVSRMCCTRVWRVLDGGSSSLTLSSEGKRSGISVGASSSLSSSSLTLYISWRLVFSHSLRAFSHTLLSHTRLLSSLSHSQGKRYITWQLVSRYKIVASDHSGIRLSASVCESEESRERERSGASSSCSRCSLLHISRARAAVW